VTCSRPLTRGLDHDYTQGRRPEVRVLRAAGRPRRSPGRRRCPPQPLKAQFASFGSLMGVIDSADAACTRGETAAPRRSFRRSSAPGCSAPGTSTAATTSPTGTRGISAWSSGCTMGRRPLRGCHSAGPRELPRLRLQHRPQRPQRVGTAAPLRRPSRRGVPPRRRQAADPRRRLRRRAVHPRLPRRAGGRLGHRGHPRGRGQWEGCRGGGVRWRFLCKLLCKRATPPRAGSPRRRGAALGVSRRPCPPAGPAPGPPRGFLCKPRTPGPPPDASCPLSTRPRRAHGISQKKHGAT
jgi:hypothetical protein